MPQELNPLDALGLSFNTATDSPAAVAPKDVARTGERAVQNQNTLLEQIVSDKQASDALFEELNQSITDSKELAKTVTATKDEIAAAQKDTTIRAAQTASSAINAYNDDINSPETAKKREGLIQRVRDAEAALAANRMKQAEGGIGGWFAGTIERSYRNDLASAQQELMQFQRAKGNSLRAMGNAALAAQTAAANGSAADIAEQQYLQQVAMNHMEELAMGRQMTNEKLEAYGKRMGFSLTTMQGLNQQLDTVIKTNQGTRAAYQALYEQAQADEYKAQVKRRNLDNEQILKLQNDFFEATGKKDMVGKLQDATSLAQLSPEVNKAFQLWFLRRNTEGVAVWSNIAIKQDTSILTEADKNLRNYGQKLVRRHNDTILAQAQRDAKGVNFAARERIMKSAEKELLDINNVQHYSKIDQIMAEDMAEMNIASNSLIETGAIILADAKDMLKELPQLQATMQSELPAGVYDTFISDTFKEVDWSISPANPARSYDGVIGSISPAVEKLAREQGQAAADAAVRDLARAASKYYEQLRILGANNYGFTGLKSIRIQGVSVRTPGATDQLTGLDATTVVNLENPADWIRMINADLRKRSVEQKQLQSKLERINVR